MSCSWKSIRYINETSVITYTEYMIISSYCSTSLPEITFLYLAEESRNFLSKKTLWKCRLPRHQNDLQLVWILKKTQYLGTFLIDLNSNSEYQWTSTKQICILKHSQITLSNITKCLSILQEMLNITVFIEQKKCFKIDC